MAQVTGKQTQWNKKLIQYAGQRVSCSEFDKGGLETDYYIIQEDGSLRFFNDLRSLNGARPNDMCNYWNNQEKNSFLKVLKTENRLIHDMDDDGKEYWAQENWEAGTCIVKIVDDDGYYDDKYQATYDNEFLDNYTCIGNAQDAINDFLSERGLI